MINKKIVTIFWYTVFFWILGISIPLGPVALVSMYFVMNPSTALVNVIITSILIIIFLAELALYLRILKQILGNFKARNEAMLLLPLEEQQKLKTNDRKSLLWFLPFVILVVTIALLSHNRNEQVNLRNEAYEKSRKTYSNEVYGISFDYCKNFSTGGKLENDKWHIYYINMSDNKDYNRRVSLDIFQKTDNNIRVYEDTFGSGTNKKKFTIDGYQARSWEDGDGSEFSYTLIEKGDVFIKIVSNSLAVNECYQSVLNTLGLKS